MIKNIWKLAAILGVITLYALINAPHLTSQTDYTTSPHGVTFHTEVTVTHDETPGRDIFNPSTELDTSQIDDLTNAPVPADPAEKILLPSSQSLETTPMIPVQGPTDENGNTGTLVIPEESPIGTYFSGEFADNSPLYDGGWMLQVNDSTTPQTITWKTTN